MTQRKKIPFSNEQIQESDYVLDLLKTQRAATLRGRAGTGKTSLAERIAGFSGNKTCVFMAPTNIAVDILRQKYAHMEDVVFCTTASALQSKKQIDYETGAVWYEPTKEEDFTERLIIHDESSMLNKKSTDTLLSTYRGSKFLFLGDPGQLPPIGDEDYCVLYEFKGGELHENFRCGQGNPLFDFIERLYFGDLTLPAQANGRIEYVDRRSMDTSKLYVTYHNATADKINKYVVKQNFRDTIQPGVKLIARETFIDQKNNKVFNSERMTIKKVNTKVRKTKSFTGNLALLAKTWNFESFVYYEVETERFKFAFSIDDNLQLFLEKLKQDKLWREYYAVKNVYPDIRLGYATTAHCVQGITLPDVGIVWPDLLEAPENIRKPLLYVAASRAQQKVEIVM